MLLSVLICFYGKKISVSEFLRSARSSFLLFPIKKENRQRLYNLLSIFILKLINFFPFFEKIYKIDKNRKKLKIGIDNCPGICYYLQVVMRRKFIRYAEVSELADEQD